MSRSFFALSVCVASGQQTIFAFPSADVSGNKEWFYQHQTVARSWNPARRWIQTSALGFGIGHSLELDATWFNLEPRTLDQSIGSVGFKWSPRLNPGYQIPNKRSSGFGAIVFELTKFP